MFLLFAWPPGNPTGGWHDYIGKFTTFDQASSFAEVKLLPTWSYQIVNTKKQMLVFDSMSDDDSRTKYEIDSEAGCFQ